MQHLDDDIADVDTLAVLQCLERVFHAGAVGFMQAVACTGLFSQRAAAGKMIGMHMGVDGVDDLDVLLRGFVDEPVLVAEHRVDGDADMEGAAAEEVGQGGVLGQQLTEKHGGLLAYTVVVIRQDSASGNPAACHSGVPSAIFFARKPCSFSSATASADIMQNGPRQ
jgi:hypothetical protein